eukprot:1992115-Amphidinium_carterae.1
MADIVKCRTAGTKKATRKKFLCPNQQDRYWPENGTNHTCGKLGKLVWPAILARADNGMSERSCLLEVLCAPYFLGDITGGSPPLEQWRQAKLPRAMATALGWATPLKRLNPIFV